MLVSGSGCVCVCVCDCVVRLRVCLSVLLFEGRIQQQTIALFHFTAATTVAWVAQKCTVAAFVDSTTGKILAISANASRELVNAPKYSVT